MKTGDGWSKCHRAQSISSRRADALERGKPPQHFALLEKKKQADTPGNLAGVRPSVSFSSVIKLSHTHTQGTNYSAARGAPGEV